MTSLAPEPGRPSARREGVASESHEPAPVAEAVPHQPGCGLKKLPNGRGRAVCVCDDETHQLRLAYIRANTPRRPRHPLALEAS